MWSVLLSKTLCFCVKTVPDSKVTNANDKSENLVKATLALTNAQPQHYICHHSGQIVMASRGAAK